MILRLLNIVLRLIPMASKMAFLLVMARFMTPADVGLFGLFSATVFFNMLLVGGDFYTYAQREFLSLSPERWSFVLQHHAVAAGVIYLLFLPAQILLFVFDFIPWQLLALYAVILVLEHLGQELVRLLVVMSKQLVASVVLFLRAGLWTSVMIPLLWYVPETRDLQLIFLSWLVSSTVAVVFGAVMVARHVPVWRWWQMDWVWMRKGLFVGATYLMGSLAYRALQTIDRYAVEALAGPEVLGVYVVFMGIAMGLISVIDAGVVFFLFPKLVAAQRGGNQARADQLGREMLWFSVALSVVGVAATYVIAPYLFAFIGKSIYGAYTGTLVILASVAVAYGLGISAHYQLYAREKDRYIVESQIGALVVFGAGVWVLPLVFTGVEPLSAVACALLAGFVWMSGYKVMRLRMVRGQ